MKIPYLSGLKVSGDVELKNLKEQVGATKFLTIDTNNNVTWSNGGGGSGSVDLTNYFTKIQSDARYQPIGNYLTSVQWSDVINKPSLFDGNYNSLTNKPSIPSLTSQLSNDSGFVTASIVNGYATENWVLNKNYLTSEVDTLDSVLGRGNSSGKNINVSGIAKFDGQLIIPSSASNQNQSIWLGNAGSTGNTAPMISFLNDLGDVTIGSVSNGQALVYENGIWINKSVVTDLSNYYTIAASNARFKPLNYVPTWDEVTGKPSIPSTAGLASITYVDNKVADLVNQAPSTLDTLNELASALGNDPNFSTTILNQIGTKANTSDVYSKATTHSLFHPLENQRLSVSDSVVFNKVKASTELVIPATSSSTNQSIWLGNAGSNGNIPAPSVTTLASLQDVAFSNLANGQSLSYDSNTGKWRNVNFQISGDYVLQNQLLNYYTRTQTDSKYKDITWLPSWNQVTGKPTNLSQFTNDLGNYGGFLLADGATYAGFAGNNVLNPYMRHTTSNEVVYLARKAELGALAYENKVYRHYSIDNVHYYTKHSWDGTGWNLRAENDVADEQPNIHLVNINGKSENSTAWNGQRYSSAELITPSTWLLGYDANTGQWKPTGKNVINLFLGLGSAAFMDGNSWLKPSNNPNTAANYNFAIGTDGTRNFIQSHSGLELQINPLGNKVVLNNATVLNELVIPATPSGANQSIWLGAAGSNGNNPATSITTLASLQDVSFSNLTSGQSLSYDSNTGKWKNTSYQIAGNYALNDGSNIITSSFRANLGLGSLAYRSEIPSASAVAWSLAQRNSAGDLYARYYNMQAGSPDEAPIANYVYSDGEGFLRKSSVTALRNWLSLNSAAYIDASQGASPYTVAQRTEGGDIKVRLIRTEYPADNGVSGGNVWFLTQNAIGSGDTDNYGRPTSIPLVKSLLGLGSFAYRSGIAGVEVDTHINNTPYDIGVAKMLRWRNYGDGHAIFDASAGLAPNGVAINNSDSQQAWAASYPTLMGWNGSNTYGVRVDSARIADRSYLANQLASYNGSNTIYWGWDGNNINFKIDNSNFGSTIPVNISGTASSATRWGGAVYTGSEVSAIQHFMIGYSETDGTYHPANVNAVRNWLGLGSAAYINATATHNAANTVVQRDSNGYLGGENIFVGYAGKYLSTMFSEETLDLVASRNNNLYRPLHIRDGNHLQIWNNAAPYFGARWDMRNDVLHQYVTRNSDGAAVAWKENWWDGANYHSLSVQPTGFLSSSRWRIGGGTGKSYDQAPLELLGNQSLPPRLGLHMQGVVASSISIGTDGAIEILNNPGTGYEQIRARDFRASERVIAGIDVQGAYTYGTTFVNGGRIWSGYDSGLAGAVSCNNWFRSNGDTGWYSASYGGGIYMIDSTWVRVYNAKNFLVEAQIRGNEFNAVAGNYNVGNYGLGLVGVYESTRYQGVFSMGGAYTPAGDGTSLANSYGIVWTHSNVGGQSKAGLGHQMLITEAGVTQTAIGNGIWTRANIYAVGQVEAPIGKHTSKMVIPTSAPAAPENGCIWIS